MHTPREFSAGANARKRTQSAVCTDLGVVHQSKRIEAGACGDLHVTQHAVSAHLHVVAQFYLAFEYAIDVYLNITPTYQATAYV